MKGLFLKTPPQAAPYMKGVFKNGSSRWGICEGIFSFRIEKEGAPMDSSGMDIPDYVFESLARCLLPKLQEYYESDEGKKALTEWEDKHKQDENK